jgi:rSAM/selenodomain-associated transferase 1
VLPDRLLIFVRNPRLGKVKTRLAATMGDEAALKVYRQLLHHTHQVAADVDAERFVYYSDEIELGDVFHAAHFHKRVQRGADLGQRMENAFAEAFREGAQRVCIIGSDCADLEVGHLALAFSVLKENDVVVGPATDGGYYLLGMRSLVRDVFRNKQWSTDRVASDTLKDAERLGLQVGLLPELNDVDTELDWNRSALSGKEA